MSVNSETSWKEELTLETVLRPNSIKLWDTGSQGCKEKITAKNLKSRKDHIHSDYLRQRLSALKKYQKSIEDMEE